MEIAANPRSPSEWTLERVTDLERMWAEGMSCNEIAAALGGVSRNAVIGKIHRCGFQAPATKQAQTANRPRRQPGWRPVQWRPPMTREERMRRARERALLQEITRPQPLPAAPPQHAGFLNVTFEQLTRGACHFPVGNDLPFLFCGQPVAKGAYCLHCFKVTHA